MISRTCAVLIFFATTLILAEPDCLLAAGRTCIVKVPRANIRSGPGTGYPAIHPVDEGERLDILEELGDWYRIRLPREGPGWIYREMVFVEEGTGSSAGLAADFEAVRQMEEFTVAPRAVRDFIKEGGLREINSPPGLPMSAIEREEQRIGRAVAARVAGKHPLLSDGRLTEYVTLVGLVCAANSERPALRWRFAVLKSDEVNSFSAPGGYVFVTRGALRQMENEAQLAGVLAHEISHTAGNHLLKEIRNAVCGAREGMIPEELQNAAAAAGARVLFKGYGSADEFEADAEGAGILHRSGYPADGLLVFLSRLSAGKGNGIMAGLDSSHPRAEDRIARLKEEISARAYSFPARSTLQDRFTKLTG